jgi:hypothetical protein
MVFYDEHMVKGLMEESPAEFASSVLAALSVLGFNCSHSDQTWALKSLDTRRGEDSQGFDSTVSGKNESALEFCEHTLLETPCKGIIATILGLVSISRFKRYSQWLRQTRSANSWHSTDLLRHCAGSLGVVCSGCEVVSGAMRRILVALCRQCKILGGKRGRPKKD